MEIYGEERSVVKTDCGDSSKMNSLGQGTKPSSNSSNAKLLPPDWLSNVVSILETILQDGDTSWVFGERKGDKTLTEEDNLNPVENDVVRRMESYTAPKSLMNDMPRGGEDDEASGMPQSKKIIDR
ncbi:hypothetical protein ACLB2K_038662 [Fragaria x ananassa]